MIITQRCFLPRNKYHERRFILTGNILHCIKYGCQLGWLIDPDDRSILIFQPQKEPELKYGKDDLIILTGVELNLTVEEVFGWLKMSYS